MPFCTDLLGVEICFVVKTSRGIWFGLENGSALATNRLRGIWFWFGSMKVVWILKKVEREACKWSWYNMVERILFLHRFGLDVVWLVDLEPMTNNLYWRTHKMDDQEFATNQTQCVALLKKRCVPLPPSETKNQRDKELEHFMFSPK